MSTTSRVQRRQLSDVLIDEGIVAREAVQEAVQIQSSTGEALGAILIDMGCVGPDDIAKTVCLHYQLPFIHMRSYDFNPKLLELFPRDFVHQHKILPFDNVGSMLLCAVLEIPSQKVLAEIPRITKRRVAFYVGSIDEIDKLLQEHYPLDENSELLKRRRHMAPIRPKSASNDEPPPEDANLFKEQSSEQLLEALDSTWDSIFDEMDGKKPGE